MAHVQSKAAATFQTGLSHTQTFDLNVAAGNAIIVPIRVSNGSDVIARVYDSVNATNMTRLLRRVDTNNSMSLDVYYLENTLAGLPTVTVETTVGSQTLRWGMGEYGNVPSSGIIDASNHNVFATTTTPGTGNLATLTDNDTLISIICTDSTVTAIAPGSGETERQEVDARFQWQDKATTTHGNYSASWSNTGSQPGVFAIIALKPAVIASALVERGNLRGMGRGMFRGH